MDKLALEQIAQQDGLQLSDILRRAAKDYIRARGKKREEQEHQADPRQLSL